MYLLTFFTANLIFIFLSGLRIKFLIFFSFSEKRLKSLFSSSSLLLSDKSLSLYFLNCSRLTLYSLIYSFLLVGFRICSNIFIFKSPFLFSLTYLNFDRSFLFCAKKSFFNKCYIFIFFNFVFSIILLTL